MNHETTVSISFSREEGISCDPAVVTVCRGQEIRWRCDKPFAIHFGWDAPWQGASLPGNERGEIVQRVEENVQYGRFKYFIAIWDAERKRIITEDPEIIIRR